MTRRLWCSKRKKRKPTRMSGVAQVFMMMKKTSTITLFEDADALVEGYTYFPRVYHSSSRLKST
jgi:hypothetical protein